MKQRFPLSILIAGLLFTSVSALVSCQREEDIPDPLPGNTIPMSFQGGLVPFDAETKARETLSFKDDAVVYVRLENNGNVVLGQAVYHGSETGWTFTYNGSLRALGNADSYSGTATCYYIPTYEGMGDYEIDLSYEHPVYEATDAAFVWENNAVSLNAWLRPKTGRLSLGKDVDNGSRPIQIVSGLSWYPRFDLTNYTFESTDLDWPLDFEASPTHYFYGFFTDPESPSLRLKNGSVTFERTGFGSDVLAPGRSGYFTVPNYSSHEGWTVIDAEDPDRTDFVVNGVSFKMVSIQGGSFTMGLTKNYSSSQQMVTLDDYKIGETEVTQELWQAVMGENPSSHQGEANLPVTNISYTQARVFAARLSELMGVTFRLPTEAEWEYAARERGGYDLRFSGSDYLPDVAWYSSNSDGNTHPVSTKVANALGLYDMSGNVCEMVSDGYQDYSSEEVVNPRGNARLYRLVYRGGYFDDTEGNCITVLRNTMSFDTKSDFVGFRLACGGPAEFDVYHNAEAIDLGLPSALKWASFNLGATRPSENGWYFGWGETATKSPFGWERYKWMEEGQNEYTHIDKYTFADNNTDGIWYQDGVFVGDGKKVLDAEDDAARQIWGDGWRIPSPADWQELIDYCGWTWEADVDGNMCLVAHGPNGNTVCFPMAYREFTSGGHNNLSYGEAMYMSSSLGEASYAIQTVHMGNTYYYFRTDLWRYEGYPIRAVYGEGNNFSASVSAEAVDFGVVPAGDPVTFTVSVENTGYLPLPLSVTCDGNVFSVSPSADVTIPAGFSLDYTVTFNSASEGDFSGTLRFSSAKLADIAPVSLSARAVSVESATYEAAGVSFKMIKLPDGTFEMGKEGIAEPVHSVTLDGFWMGETEVTQELWTAVMGSNPSYYQGEANLPVESVTWWNVQVFITKLNALTGAHFRLPTEAEWEYAAREAGLSDTRFSGSETLSDVGWYSSNSSNRIHPVKSLLPNGYGLYDMSGNVWEWCGDFYQDYPSEAQTDSRGGAWGDGILRGNSYDNGDGYTVYYRNTFGSFSASQTVGFRLAMGGSEDMPEKVDLGLPSGLLWSSLNLGSARPQDIGEYYAWGETEPKWTFYWSNYKYIQGGGDSYRQITKYTVDDHYDGIWYEDGAFIGDGRDVLDLSDDPARANWGDDWRVPSRADWQELYDNCDVYEESRDGLNGWRFTSRINGNSIFLPATGWRDGTDSYSLNSTSYYPSSSLGDPSYIAIGFYPASTDAYALSRQTGYPVRPVSGEGGAGNFGLEAPSTHSLGAAPVGESRQSTFTVRNTGYLPLTFQLTGSMDGVSFSPSGDITVPAGTDQQIVFTFTPASAQKYTGTFQIVSDRLAAPLDVAVSGVGYDPSTPLVSMARKYWLHFESDYCHPQVSFVFSNGTYFHLAYPHSAYYDNAYRDLIEGIYLYPSSDFSYEQRTDLWVAGPLTKDEWVDEKITIYPDGIVEYCQNDTALGTYCFQDLDLATADSFYLRFSPEGWWTGHEHWMDDFYIETKSITYSDSFDSFETEFWEDPVNPDGVRVEDGVMKMSQSSTDQDFRLTSKTINL